MKKNYSLTVVDEKLLSGAHIAEGKKLFQVEKLITNSAHSVQGLSGRSSAGDHSEFKHTQIASLLKVCEDPVITGIQYSDKPFKFEGKNHDLTVEGFENITVNQNQEVPRGFPEELPFEEDLEIAYYELRNWLKSQLTSVELR